MAGLTVEQKRHYDEQGYVMIEGLFDPEELRPFIQELEAAVDKIGRAYHAEGRIKSLYTDHGFKTRFLKMFEDCEGIYNELAAGSPLIGPEMFNLLRHPKILDAAESIMGPEVHCEGRHVMRPKMPGYGVADFRWHDDTLFQARRITYVEQQYGLGPVDPTRTGKVISRIVAAPQEPEPGFWIPLVDVDERNGCLQVLPGGHKHTPPYHWQWDPSLFVPQLEGLVPQSVPMKVGDALLLHQHIPHNSPPNHSDHIRWSIDIRYQDGRLPVKSARKPGFLARSKERPQGVVTTYEGYMRLREAAEAYYRLLGNRLA
ncbi:MAG: phytanoyl-CoA dioxygenase family protein [Chloroflexi bacterium]|nr:phytanoyl-CoA dioxygenase family protein [Chloroflexota bacterium]